METAHCNADGLQRVGRHFDSLFLFCVLATGPNQAKYEYAGRSPTHKIETDMQIVNFPERNDTLTGHHSFCEINELDHIVINLVITGWKTKCGLLKKSWRGKSPALDSSKHGADHTLSSSPLLTNSLQCVQLINSTE